MLSTHFAHIGRLIAAVFVACICLQSVQGPALAATIYDTQILQRMKFTPSQRAKVRKILSKSKRERDAIFRKYGINPRAKPVFKKLQAASSELQALRSRQKRQMKVILSREQYKTYLALLEATAARVIKASRNKP